MIRTTVRMGRRQPQAQSRPARTPRTETAHKLLQHGALTAGEFIQITGWQPRAAYKALENLASRGAAERIGQFWTLA